jgi:phospho-N-acetylmuramoyl-pentapeptide-transferase
MSPALADAARAMLMSAAACVLVGLGVVPVLARLQGRQPARYEDCPPLLAYQHAKRKTPSMGGLFLLAVAVLMAAAWGGLSRPTGWLVLVAIVPLAALGLADDLLKFRRPNARGLGAWPKLFAALAVGGLLGLVLVRGVDGAGTLEVPWLGRAITPGWGWVPLSMLVVAGSAHAVNLSDGLDGLAAGCLAVLFTTLGLVAIAQGPRAHALVCWSAALAGACLGFLWFNSYPAGVFLGDVGALGLGAALGALGLLTAAALWLVVLGGVFVAEAGSVLLQVASYHWAGGRRIFRVAPLHHHFQLGGMPEPKLMVRFWVVAALLALAGLTGMVRT